MSIFSKKNNNGGKIVVAKEVKVPVVVAEKQKSLEASNKTANRPVFYIKQPRISEKASMKAESEGVYVFEVTEEANKQNISNAIRESYKVTPVKVNITTIPPKKVFVRGKWGVKGGGKKVYVYLKKGDKIEIV